MTPAIITTVDAQVSPELEEALIDGYRRLIESERPAGLVSARLLRGQGGRWRLESEWRDMDSLVAARQSGRPPAALVLLQGLGIESTHEWFTVEAGF